MPYEDPLLGPATLSELKKTVAICTQTHNTEIQIVPIGYYTDGSTIFISSPPTDIDPIKRWLLLEGGTIHESWHILFQSDFHLLQEFVKTYKKKFQQKIPFIEKIAHDIVNIIEDARIEYLGKKRFFGTKKTIQFSNFYWLEKRPSFRHMRDWEIFIEGLLQLGVCDGLKESVPNHRLEILIKTANFYLQWAKIQENSKASFLAAQKIMDLLLKNFHLEGTYSQQVRSPPPQLGFKPHPSSAELQPEDVPDLPEELKTELEKVQQKRPPQKRPSSNEGESSDDTKSTQDTKAKTEQAQSTEEMNSHDKELTSEAAAPPQDQALNGSESKKPTPASEGGNADAQHPLAEKSDSTHQTGLDNIDESKDTINQKTEENAIGTRHESPTRGQIDETDATKNQDPNINTTSGNSAQLSDDFQSSNQESTNQNAPPPLEVSELIGSTELRVIDLEKMDPFKSNLINPAALKIKIDDLVKRNYSLLRDKELEDLAKTVVKQIEQLGIYKNVFFTKTFDIGVELELIPSHQTNHAFKSLYNSLRSLIQITINQFKALFKSGSETTSQLKFGRLDSRRMVRGLVTEDPRIFKKKRIEEGKNEFAIALLIDQSGSMFGEKILNAQKAAILFGEVLNSLRLTFAIYGWTDIDFSNRALHYYLKRRSGSFTFPRSSPLKFPPGINSEIFTIFTYKEFTDPYESCKNKLGMISAFCDNSDHNAIAFVTEKLLQTKKRVKLLMVLSDGQPNALSYDYIAHRYRETHHKSYNIGNIGINLTRQAIEMAQKQGVQTLCISIDKSKNYQEQIYGKNNYILVNPQNIQELPVKVAKILALLLRRAGIKI